MAKPKPAATRNLGNELGKINGSAADALATRNPALLEALLSNISGISPALTSARTGEMDSMAAWLRDNKGLKKSNQAVQAATREATRPTSLEGLLNTKAEAALNDPTAGNTVLQNLVKTSGPSRLLETMTGQAQQGLEDNGQLTPEEERLATQGARASMASRGLNGGSPAVLADVLGRTEYVTGRQDRARTYAAGTEALGQSSRAGDLSVASTVEGAIQSARGFATNVNAQDMTKQQMDLAAKTGAADYRLKTNPKLMAYSTPSMVPGALSAGSATTNQADVYTNILGYGADVNNTNFNALESRYLNSINAGYANQAGQRQLAAAKAAGDSSLTGSLIGAGGAVLGGVVAAGGAAAGGSALAAGASAVAAAAAVCWLAREVFGPESGEWLRYREWLQTKAPARWFRRYHLHARRWAALCRTNTRARYAFTKLLINQLNFGDSYALPTSH